MVVGLPRVFGSRRGAEAQRWCGFDQVDLCLVANSNPLRGIGIVALCAAAPLRELSSAAPSDMAPC